MGVPARLLGQGEEVVVDLRAHVWVLARPIALATVLIAGAAVAATYRPPAPVAWAVVAVLVLVLAHLLGRYLRWRSTSLVVTNERLILRRGVLARSGREIPLGAVTDVSYHQGFLARVLRAGDLVVESAGHEGQEVIAAVPRPDEVQAEIVALLAGRRQGGAGLSLPEQLDRLDVLRRRGVITDDEFDASKARLLGR